MTGEPLGPVRLALVSLTSIVMWTLGALAFNLAGLLLLPWRGRPWVARFGQGLLGTGFAHYVVVLRWFGIVNCECVGFERIMAAGGGCLVAPNHPAMWDVVFLLGKLRPVSCIFKASLIRNPFFTGGAVLADFIPNAPAIRMIKHTVQVLRAGGRVLYFPEGTRTRKREGALNPLQGSMGLVAKQAAVPVWPVFVTTDSDYLSKGWPVWRLPRRRTRITMRVGEPVCCGERESAEEFTARLQGIYQEGLT